MSQTYRKSGCEGVEEVLQRQVPSFSSFSLTWTLEEPVLDSTIINSLQEDLGPLRPLDLSIT